MVSRFFLISADTDSSQLDVAPLTGGRWFYAGNSIASYRSFKKRLESVCVPLAPSREFHDFVASHRDRFVKSLDSFFLSLVKEHAFAGMAVGTGLKNPHDSDFMVACFSFAFLVEIVDRQQDGMPIVVVAEDRDLIKALEEYRREKGLECVVIPSPKLFGGRAFQMFRRLAFILHMFIFSLILWGAARWRYPRKEGVEDRQGIVVLVTTYFAAGDFSSGNEFQDRHFPGLVQWLRQNGVRPLILPLYERRSLKETLHAIEKARQCANVPFVLHEDLLSLGDYFGALWKTLDPKGIKGIEAKGKDICSLEEAGFRFPYQIMRANIHKSLYAIQVFWGWVRIAAARRIAASGINVEEYISWYENTVGEKAAVMGFRVHLPRCSFVGAQLLNPAANHLSLFVTDGETEGGWIPDRLIVPGQAFVAEYSKYTSKASVVAGASMRYHYLWGLWDDLQLRSATKGTLRVLVPLPQSPLLSQLLLEAVLRLKDGDCRDHLDVKIKLHPSNAVAALARQLEAAHLELNAGNVVEGKLSELLIDTGLVISTESGTLLEAACLGIPSILFRQSIGIEFSPFISPAAQTLVRIAYSGEEMESLVKKVLDERTRYSSPGFEAAAAVLSESFLPNGDESLQPFLPR